MGNGRAWRHARRAWPAALIVTSGLAALAGTAGFGTAERGNSARKAALLASYVPARRDPFVERLLRAARPDTYLVGVAQRRTAVLGTHTLTFHGEDENELVNVTLCVQHLDGAVVPPGEVFSYNAAVGERTEERGFRPGLMYVAGEVVLDMGGGVCIPSTALYNAALLSDLQIVERHHHSGPVHYAEPGLDAAVVFGQKDFRFRNTSEHPVTIHASLLGNNLTVSIIGVPVPGRRVELEAAGFRRLSFTEEKSLDPALTEGQPEVKQEGRTGYVVTVFRTVYENGKRVRRETLGRDAVAARNRIVAMHPLDDPDSPEAKAKAEEAAKAAAATPAGETPPAVAVGEDAAPAAAPTDAKDARATTPEPAAAPEKREAPTRAEIPAPKAEKPTPMAEKRVPAKADKPVAPPEKPARTPDSAPAKPAAPAIAAPARPTARPL